MKIKCKKLSHNARLPVKATDGSGAYDISSVSNVRIQAGRAGVASTGLAFEIPKGHVMLLFSRSGQGFNHDVRLSNCVGVIDSDYRGEVKVKLKSDGEIGPYIVSAGDRIAQAMVIKSEDVEWEEGELSETARGEGGFGSTGAWS